MGTELGCSALSRSASASERGVSTCTSPKGIRPAAGPVSSPGVADLARRLAVARGDERADLVLRGGRVLSVFTREWLEADVAIAGGYIAGLGDYDGVEIVDATGRYVVPGFIDAHMPLEATKLLP